MNKHSKESILSKYIDLTKKLSKFPSKRETIELICSYDSVAKYFGNLSNLKLQALKQYPDLEYLAAPSKLVLEDIEAYRLGLKVKQRNKENDDLIKKVSSLSYLSQFSKNIFTGKVEPYNPPKSKKKPSRAINLTLSDLHFGADIKEVETGFLDYGSVQEARRFATIIKQTIEYKPQYRKDTELHVNLLGDIIQNKLHDPQSAAPVAEQICRAIHLLTQGFSQLAENFSKVIVHCSTGNHGRDTSRHKTRATSGKWDSLETVIYYALKHALSKYKNVTFDIPKTPFVVYSVFGNKIFATHGDTVLNPGNPGKNLNIGKLETQINRINASMKDKDEVKVAIVGHTHCASVSNLSSGAHLITNGCLSPADDFAVSIGILESDASQTIFEMTEKYPLGDLRFIRVSSDNDTDEELDSIIKPWESL